MKRSCFVCSSGEPDTTPITDSPLHFPTPFVDLHSNGTAGREARCSIETHRHIFRGTNRSAPSSDPCQYRLFQSPYKMALTAKICPALTADASSAVTSVMVAIILRGSVTYNESAYRRSSSIYSCGVGSSRLVRSDGGRWRRRAQCSISSRSQLPPTCRNRAIR